MVRAPCCEKMGLKKGPWTPDEDQVLINYIQLHGHGNWRALPKQAGKLLALKSKHASSSFVILVFMGPDLLPHLVSCFLQVYWGVERVADYDGPTIWGQILNEGISAGKKRMPLSTYMKCLVIGNIPFFLRSNSTSSWLKILTTRLIFSLFFNIYNNSRYWNMLFFNTTPSVC